MVAFVLSFGADVANVHPTRQPRCDIIHSWLQISEAGDLQAYLRERDEALHSFRRDHFGHRVH